MVCICIIIRSVCCIDIYFGKSGYFFLHEDFTMKSLVGCVLIGAGTLIMVL